MTSMSLGKRHVVSALVVLAGLAIGVRRGLANAPAGRYTIMSGGTATGTVLDTQTGLTWQQAPPASNYTWANATSYCSTNAGALPGTGWRLPSMTELQLLVDDSLSSPAIDPTAFPNTGAMSFFWTSSPYVPVATYVWCVGFKDGASNDIPENTMISVRCVR